MSFFLLLLVDHGGETKLTTHCELIIYVIIYLVHMLLMDHIPTILGGCNVVLGGYNLHCW